MTTFHYEGMDSSGKQERGFLDAESKDEATAKLKERGLFTTNLAAFAAEVTPEWSAMPLAPPRSIPSGRLLPQGLFCTYEHRWVSTEGTLNVLGLNGELHVVFDKPGAARAVLDLPVHAISTVQKRGLFRKSLRVTTSTLEEHVFRGSLSEVQRLLEWAMFVAR